MSRDQLKLNVEKTANELQTVTQWAYMLVGNGDRGRQCSLAVQRL
jgi:hypothetical protein